MSSISAYNSPLQLLQSQLQSSVSNGTIKSDDQDTLAKALTDIDSSLTSSRTSEKSAAPTDLKSKIDDLISTEVSNGKLTADQATELKSVFADAFGKGGPGGAEGARGPGGPRGGGGPEGPGGAGGPPPISSDDDDSDDASDTSITGAADVLQQFLKTLQESLEARASNGYGAAGSSTSSATSAVNALLLDFKT